MVRTRTSSEQRDLSSADRQLVGLGRLADITSVNPANGRSEQEKFLAHARNGERYNPRYEYVRPRRDLAAARAALASMVFDDTPLGQVFAGVAEETTKRLRMIESVGKDDFTARSIEVYGFPTERLIRQAQSILRSLPQDPAPDIRPITAEDLAERLKRELDKYQAKWLLEISDRAAAKVNVIPSQEKIELKSGERFSEGEARRLIVHEINAHLLRALNGRLQPFKIFATGLADSERTDEGLATVVEELTETIRNDTFRLYAGRVLAASLSRTSSFFEVFSELSHSFSQEEAFYITQRVKRGLMDTSKPGGFIKDYIYLDGRDQVKRYLDDHGDIELLYCGNIGIRDVPLVKALIAERILNPPAHLPSFLTSIKRGENAQLTLASFDA